MIRAETITITVEGEDASQMVAFRQGLAEWLSEITVVRVLPGMHIEYVDLIQDYVRHIGSDSDSGPGPIRWEDRPQLR